MRLRVLPLRGFTLIELMVVIAITAVLAALALPDFMATTRQTRLRAEANTLANAIKYARSEAIRQNATVTICKSSNSSASDASCTSGSTPGWEMGWIVFVNTNSDNNRSPATEPLLSVKAPSPTGITAITATGAGPQNYLSFNASGDPSGPLRGAGTVKFKENAQDPGSMYVVINTAGRVRVLNLEECGADPLCV